MCVDVLVKGGRIRIMRQLGASNFLLIFLCEDAVGPNIHILLAVVVEILPVTYGPLFKVGHFTVEFHPFLDCLALVTK